LSVPPATSSTVTATATSSIRSGTAGPSPPTSKTSSPTRWSGG
jgi:hypothetical protein